jgi:hypothetical protein
MAMYQSLYYSLSTDNAAAVKLKLQLRSELEFVSYNENQNSGTNNLKVAIGELNFVSRIIQWSLAIGNCPVSAGQGEVSAGVLLIR